MLVTRLRAAEGAPVSVESVRLPVEIAPKSIDADVYRRRAAGEAPLEERQFIPASSVSTIVLSNDDDLSAALADQQGLVVIANGEVHLDSASGVRSVLGPGDMFAVEPGLTQGSLSHAGECRLVRVATDALLHGTGEPVTDGPRGTASRREHPANAKVMYKSDDDVSFFRDFPALFSQARAAWSAEVPVAGLLLKQFADGTFVDWHPEVVNVFLVVLTGELELEVSGDGAVEIFRPGDVCLASDRTGVGHIDRMRGETTLALLVVEDIEAWS